jgi:misacylated tRNA(Ala) deacylase
MSSFVKPDLESVPYILHCQKDPYARDLETNVLACFEICAWINAYAAAPAEGPDGTAQAKTKKKKKKKKTKGESATAAAAATVVEPRYGILMADTVLFPTGGGQPNDLGTIAFDGGIVSVLDVVRLPQDQRLVLHYVADPIESGTVVTLTVDWTRRFDHMQQHSAQHLVTALALPKWPTTTWNLSKNITGQSSPCYLDLDASSAEITEEVLAALEDRVNERVRANLAVTPQIFSAEEFAELSGVRSGSNGIKAGRGPIRTVTIAGIESNTCCGTHVASTGHLQSIKLLRSEKSPAAKNHTRVWFLAGSRVLQLAGNLHKTSCQLTRVLTSGPSEHLARVAEIVQNQKEMNRATKQLLRSHAALCAHLAHHADFAATHTIVQHLDEGNADFMKNFLREAGENAALRASARVEVKEETKGGPATEPNKPTIVVTVGGGAGGKQAGACMMQGEPSVIGALGKAVLALLEGARGGGRNGKFQLKIPAGILTESKVERLAELAKTTTIEMLLAKGDGGGRGKVDS